jgi:hypothetical protein
MPEKEKLRRNEGPGGYFVVPRGWRDDPVFQDQPFSEPEAWLWLLEHAAWKDQSRRLKQFQVHEHRGELAVSSRFLAAAWNWKEPRVRRFRDRLAKAGKISVAETAGGVTVIAIIDYDAGQTPTQFRRSSDAVIDATYDVIIPAYSTCSGDPVGSADAVADAVESRACSEIDANLNTKNTLRRRSLDSSSPVSAEPMPAAPSEDLFPGAQVVRMPSDQVDQAAAAWNEMAERCGLTPIMGLTPARRSALRMRLRECGGLDGWRAALDQVRSSDFLLGTGDRAWKADFDFVLQPKSFTKLREGAYANRGNALAPKPGKLNWLVEKMRGEQAPPPPEYDVDMTAEYGR